MAKRKYNSPSSSGYKPGMSVKRARYAGAVEVAKVVGKQLAKKAFNVWRAKTIAKKTKKKSWNNHSTAIYAGRMKKPKRYKPNLESTTKSKGYHVTLETYGKLEDPHAGYITHSTLSIVHFSRAIVGALLRKLFAKAGIMVTSSKEILPLTSFSSSTGFRIDCQLRRPSDGSTTNLATYIIGTPLNLETVISGYTALIDQIESYMSNTSEFQPQYLALYQSNNGDVEHRIASRIEMQTEHITLYGSSSLKVQNRTKGDLAAAGVEDSERVDNQPLKGMLYSFKNATPMMKQPSYLKINTIDELGLSLIRSAELDQDFQNMPDPRLWKNCDKKSYQILQPGQIKKTVVSHKYSGNFIQVLNRIRVIGSLANQVHGGQGRCQIIMLEEKLRTSGTNPVTLQYEREFKTGCFFKSTRTPVLLSDLLVANLNNVPV